MDKYHNDYNSTQEMLCMSVIPETSLTFSILVITLASLFALDPILGNQQALAQGVGGGGGAVGGGGGGGGAVGGGSFASSGGAEGEWCDRICASLYSPLYHIAI